MTTLTFFYLMFTTLGVLVYILLVLWTQRRKKDVVLSIAEARLKIDTAKNLTRNDKRLLNFKTYLPVVSLFINCNDVGEKLFQAFLLFSKPASALTRNSEAASLLSAKALANVV